MIKIDLMKKIIILFLLVSFTAGAKAQTFAEWFQQKKTQKKYLLQQIAGLQLYIGSIKKGYSIAQKGLTTMSEFKNGEFHLHSDYFKSLKNVNPRVKNYSKVADIIFYQIQIVQTYRQACKRIKKSYAFTPNEISYMNRVFGRLMDDCNAAIDELITVTTSGKLEMTDDARVERIDALYEEMEDKYSFVKSFTDETIEVADARAKEKNDVEAGRLIYGVKNE
jgi:hypothetical protein